MRWNEITGLSEQGKIGASYCYRPIHTPYLSNRRRRICPGMPVAEQELWLAISRLLWSFTFHALPDEPISLQEYEGTSGRRPLPFRLKLVPRIENLQDTFRTKTEVVV